MRRSDRSAPAGATPATAPTLPADLAARLEALAAGPDAEAVDLTDAGLWPPVADAVLGHAGLAPTAGWSLLGGGSFPVLRSAHDLVVKLYPPFLDGGACAVVEGAALAALDGLPVPQLVASGALLPAPGPRWPWPYLVMRAARGTSVHDLRAAGATDEDLQPLASFAATVLEATWRTPVPDTGSRLQPGWAPFLDLLRHRRAVAPAEHLAAGRLSARLCDRLDAWLPDLDALLVPAGPAVLLHGDLHGDHLLAERLADGTLAPTAVIDLSDAIAGHPAYDLVALHLDAFGGSRVLLRTVLGAVPPRGRPRPDHALAWSVLHEFDPFERWTGERLAWLGSFDDPDDLAVALWAA